MNCSEARSAIGPDLILNPSSAEVGGAYEHYRLCEACQRYYTHQARFADRLRLLSSAKAPPALREKVVAALDEETKRVRQALPRPTRRRWIASGFITAAAAAAAIWLVARPEPVNPVQRAATMLAAIAQDSGDVGSRMTSDQVDLLRAWLAPRVGAAVDIPDIPEARLTGGQVALLEEVATAAVHYRYHGMLLLYVLIPASEVTRQMPHDDELWSFTANGYEVVLWRDGDTIRAVVAPMARPALEAIAEHCRNKAMI